jgi:hypothetical protein
MKIGMSKKVVLAFWMFLLCLAPAAYSFVLFGPGAAEGNTPVKDWQTRGANAGWNIGYDFPGDIGAPVFPDEFYRWNVPVITYAFDEAFVLFFGSNGVRAIDQAFQILNDLPPASRMSADLSEFPLNTLRRNYEAAQFGLLDIKSTAMTLILEELGLAQADRWVWALHARRVLPGPGTPGEYDVINRYNIDPVTWRPTPYVNETLYTYSILEVPPPGPQTPYSDAVEDPIPFGAIPNLPVTSLAGAFTPGNFFSGLTRDDVGGLRYLWLPRQRVNETLLPGTIPGSPRGWIPFIGTNFLGTNVIVTNVPPGGTNNLATAGLRGGVDKVQFRKVFFDSFTGGTFTPITNRYVDRVVVGNTGRIVEQVVLRPIQLPDFIFTVEDINLNSMFRTTTANWINNDLLTPTSNQGGPGIIQGPITIAFNKIFPIFFNQTPNFVTEPVETGPFASFARGFSWASFDGTTNAPIVYPEYLHFNFRAAARAQGGF